MKSLLLARLLEHTLHLLQAVLERTLENDDLHRSSYNDGRMGGFDLPELVKSLLFVVVEHAPGATRFANGLWEDIGQVMPLVDRMVRAAGWPGIVSGAMFCASSTISTVRLFWAYCCSMKSRKV